MLRLVRLDTFRRCIEREIHCATALKVQSGIRTEGWWLKDHRPGAYPKTAEERAAAAAKYGLRPEDYKPIKDEGFGFGDYPDLGPINYEMKDPFENWNNDVNRRNWGEPTPIHYHYTHEQSSNYGFTGIEDISGSESILKFCLWFSAIFGTIYLFCLYDARRFRPLMPKQYPFDYARAFPNNDPRLFPLVHYTFEPGSGHAAADESHSGHH